MIVLIESVNVGNKGERVVKPIKIKLKLIFKFQGL